MFFVVEEYFIEFSATINGLECYLFYLLIHRMISCAIGVLFRKLLPMYDVPQQINKKHHQQQKDYRISVKRKKYP